MAGVGELGDGWGEAVEAGGEGNGGALGGEGVTMAGRRSGGGQTTPAAFASPPEVSEPGVTLCLSPLAP